MVLKKEYCFRLKVYGFKKRNIVLIKRILFLKKGISFWGKEEPGFYNAGKSGWRPLISATA